MIPVEELIENCGYAKVRLYDLEQEEILAIEKKHEEILAIEKKHYEDEEWK